jgi:small-conductance mechanosensitive channel
LCNTILTNQAFPDQRAKARINIGVAYGSDLEKVKQVLTACALAVPDVLHDPPPETFFTSFGDSAMQMALFFWVDDYVKVFPVTDQINSLLLRRLADNGITIPYPTTSVYLHKDL